MFVRIGLARPVRLFVLLAAGSLLVGPALSQAPLRQAARMVRAEGGTHSSLKAALAALASVVSGAAITTRNGELAAVDLKEAAVPRRSVELPISP